MTEFDDGKPAGGSNADDASTERAADPRTDVAQTLLSVPSSEGDTAQTGVSVPHTSDDADLREPMAGEPQNAPEIAIPEIEPGVPPIAEPAAGEPLSTSTEHRFSAGPASMERTPPRTLFFARLVQAIWVGSAVFLALAALAVFRALGPTGGADAVGAMLTRWHYIALLAPAILILVEWRRMRSRMVMLLFVAVILAVLQGFTDLRIRRIRTFSPIPISSLDRNDPLRRHFGALHGFSSLLLLAQIVAGIAVIAAEPDPD